MNNQSMLSQKQIEIQKLIYDFIPKLISKWIIILHYNNKHSQIKKTTTCHNFKGYHIAQHILTEDISF